MLAGAGREGIVVVEIAAVVALLGHVAACGDAEGIEFGVEVGLRFDEGTTVVSHGLVAGIGVLGEDGEAGSEEDQEQKDEGEDSVHNEEDDTHDTGYDTLVCVSKMFLL